jgi:hypothetical protein
MQPVKTSGGRSNKTSLEAGWLMFAWVWVSFVFCARYGHSSPSGYITPHCMKVHVQSLTSSLGVRSPLTRPNRVSTAGVMQTVLHWVPATAAGGLPGRCRVLRPPYAIAGLVIHDLGQIVRVRLAHDSIFKLGINEAQTNLFSHQFGNGNIENWAMQALISPSKGFWPIR